MCIRDSNEFVDGQLLPSGTGFAKEIDPEQPIKKTRPKKVEILIIFSINQIFN